MSALFTGPKAHLLLSQTLVFRELNISENGAQIESGSLDEDQTQQLLEAFRSHHEGLLLRFQRVPLANTPVSLGFSVTTSISGHCQTETQALHRRTGLAAWVMKTAIVQFPP